MDIIYAIIIALSSLMPGKSSADIQGQAQKIYQNNDYNVTNQGIIVIDTNDLT